MIVGGHGRSGAGNRGGGRGVGLLQRRDRPAGAGCEGRAARGAPTLGADARLAAARALADGHGPVDPRLATAGGGAATGAVGGGAAGVGGRPAGAPVRRAADARRARRTQRASRDARDRRRRDRRGLVRTAAHVKRNRRAPDDHAGTAGAGVGEPVAISAARVRALDRRPDDVLRGPRGRLERRRHEAGIRRPFPAPSARGRAVGPLDGGRIGGRRAERDERATVAARDPGSSRGVRDSDRRAGRARAAVVRRELWRDATGRRAVGRVAGGADRGRGAAGALAAVARADGRRARERR
jgi:hypothetical protein